ncbi:hypothetical protein BDV97DRAFT_393572 [Delphinella strobiligena]|nr:hypothetical protein BDV97DRAFT_393572 [Delphinella strobiligena]
MDTDLRVTVKKGEKTDRNSVGSEQGAKKEHSRKQGNDDEQLAVRQGRMKTMNSEQSIRQGASSRVKLIDRQCEDQDNQTDRQGADDEQAGQGRQTCNEQTTNRQGKDDRHATR